MTSPMSAAGDSRPLLAITMGDPAGVGPEVTVKALADGELTALCRPLVIGDAGVLGRAAQAVGASKTLSIRPWKRPEDAPFDRHGIDVLDLANVDAAEWSWGKLSAGSGRA